jgi:hypothetical protein
MLPLVDRECAIERRWGDEDDAAGELSATIADALVTLTLLPLFIIHSLSVEEAEGSTVAMSSTSCCALAVTKTVRPVSGTTAPLPITSLCLTDR